MPEIFVDESAGAIPASSQDRPLPAVPAESGPEAAKDEAPAIVAEPEKGGDGASSPARTALTGAFNEDGTENKDASAAVGGDVKPESPDGYELTFGESTRVDADLLGQFKTAAHEMGITNGQAQKMASLYEAHMAKMSESHQKAAARALNDYVAEQNRAISARPGFKEDVRLATVATRMFGSDELNRVFSETAIGSHPAMFDLMVKVGRMAEKMKAEPGFEGRSAAAPERPLHERMWPNGGVGFTK